MRFFEALALLGLTSTTYAITVPHRTNINELTSVVGTANRDHVSIQINGIHPVAPSALDAEFAKLAEIKHETAILHARLRKQEKSIVDMLKTKFRHCDGFQCIVQTAMQKAPDFAHLIAEHFSHDNVEPEKNDEFNEATSPPLPSRKDRPPLRTNSHLHPPFVRHQPHCPFGVNPSRLPDHRDPSLVSPKHGYSSPSQLPPDSSAHGPSHPHHVDRLYGPPGCHHHCHPSFLHHILHRHVRTLKAVLMLLAVSFLFFVLVKVIRHHVPCFKDPRRRAERARRREERRTRCQYRQAARQHRLSSWWAAHRPIRRSAAATSDYDEKRTLIMQQEGLLETVMQREIRDLEMAAELEDGQDRPQLARVIPQELDTRPSSNHFSEQQGYAPALSVHSAPPPRYEAELDEDMMVVGGFSDTPSNTDETPESSIVDFSPRMSCETLNTNASRSGYVD